MVTSLGNHILPGPFVMVSGKSSGRRRAVRPAFGELVKPWFSLTVHKVTASCKARKEKAVECRGRNWRDRKSHWLRWSCTLSAFCLNLVSSLYLVIKSQRARRDRCTRLINVAYGENLLGNDCWVWKGKKKNLCKVPKGRTVVLKCPQGRPQALEHGQESGNQSGDAVAKQNRPVAFMGGRVQHVGLQMQRYLWSLPDLCTLPDSPHSVTWGEGSR